MSVPFLVRKFFGSITWRVPVTDPTLFLTFDDGPVPEVTPLVLDILNNFRAKATFFCLGENVRKYPDLYKRILAEGHAVGNHTFHHLNGWKTGSAEYVGDVDLCDEAMGEFDHGPQSIVLSKPMTLRLFRPPYGKIKPSQVSALKSRYSIVMWDVLSRDYNDSLTAEACFFKVRENAKNGSIIVFHDSLKAKKRVLSALPKVLDYFSEKEFAFKSIH